MNTRAKFPTLTRWDLIRHADSPDHPRARKALEELLQLYLDPIYAFIRRSGFSREDAEDSVQGFFAHAVQSNALARADESRGRFRTFLLTCLKQFLTDEYRRNAAAKRGGTDRPVSFDAMSAEQRYLSEPADNLTPERLLTRKMTLQIIENVVQELRADAGAEGNTAVFDALYAQISQDDTAEGYQALSVRFSLSVSDLKSKAYRLRKRFKALYLDRVGELCDDEHMAKAEAIALEDSL